MFRVSPNQEAKAYKYLYQEVFGPMLHIVEYETLDEAIELFNSTEYALTGGVYCQSQNDLDYILPKLEVGNIYVNRPNTGARVAIEPFGGFKMSGTGPKAGSENYLSHFYFHSQNSSEIKFSYSKESQGLSSFEMSRESKRVFSFRKSFAQQILVKAIDEFQTHFVNTDGQWYLVLEDLLTKINQGHFDIVTNEYPNHSIQGQLSYHKKNLAIGRVLFIDGGKLIRPSIFCDIVLNILVGNGINIITTNIDAFNNWCNMRNQMIAQGLSIYNMNLVLFDKKTTLEVAKTYSFPLLILANQELDQELNLAFINKDYTSFIPKIIYDADFINFDKRINEFVHLRSFAINTMRHGAPLEINI